MLVRWLDMCLWNNSATTKSELAWDEKTNMQVRMLKRETKNMNISERRTTGKSCGLCHVYPATIWHLGSKNRAMFMFMDTKLRFSMVLEVLSGTISRDMGTCKRSDSVSEHFACERGKLQSR
jgi:hypothetical protein